MNSSPPSPPLLSVVVAAYDEAGNVGELVERLGATLRGLTGWRWEIVFVVSGEDGTRGTLEELAARIPALRVIPEDARGGLGVAMARGFAAAASDATAVVTLDADLNHQPEQLPALLAALDRYDIVVGSRLLSGSRVTGLPLWKTVLSRTMNLLLGWLSGPRVRDKTSGYRAYRAEALRRMTIRHPGFAFLPDLLLQAHEAGLAVGEVPILFTARRHGKSKMAILPTSVSYMALLRQRELRAAMLAAVLVAVGLAVRAAITLPPHKGIGHADNLLTGMQALRIAEGEWPIFFSGVRIGALESYLTALLMALSIPDRVALAMEPLLWGAILLLAGCGLFRELLGRDAALPALLLLALPSPSFLVWSSLSNGYPPIYALSAVVLWLAARAGRTGLGTAGALGLGCVVGVASWQSVLTLAATLPAALWLLWRRPELRRPRRVHLAGALGVLLGAAPWIAAAASGALAGLADSFATRPVGSLRALTSNVAYFVTYGLPEAVAPRVEGFSGLLTDRLGTVHRALQPVGLVVWIAALLALLLADRRKPEPLAGRLATAKVLFLLVVGTVAVLNCASTAGTFRGITVRYVLPLYLVAPIAMAALAVRCWGRWHPAAWAALALVATFNVSGYHWPGRPSRVRWSKGEANERALVAQIERRGIAVVVGGFWTAYPINFVSSHRIVAVPCSEDYYRYRERVPAGRVRWAMVSAADRELSEWAAAAGVSGALAPAGAAHLFLPDRPGPVPLDSLLATCRLPH